jgi:drug/metabolite transporter (DMT)-like permease
MPMSTVFFGLLASIGWGVSDFGGGLASRRGPVLGVLLWSQVASLAVGVPILLLTDEPAMGPTDVFVAAVSGTLGASGLALLYRGLSVGRMGVVAPVAAVITATIPVVFGFATEGVPPMPAIAGIASAVISVVLVSRGSSGADGGSRGMGYAVGAGTLFGSFTIAASYIGEGLILTPVVVIRFASIATITAWILLRRQPWRVPPRLMPSLLMIGLLDMGATASYLAAIAVGPLAIAAILASLYPVATTILAATILRERVTRVHAAGIVAAGLAVALIAGANAG